MATPPEIQSVTRDSNLLDVLKRRGYAICDLEETEGFVTTFRAENEISSTQVSIYYEEDRVFVKPAYPPLVALAKACGWTVSW